MRPILTPLAGTGLVTLAGLSWAVASVHYEVWLEAFYCLMIAAGFSVAAIAARRSDEHGTPLFSAGLALGALGIAMPVITGAFQGSFSLLDSWTVLSLTSLSAAAFAFLAWNRSDAADWGPLGMRIALAAAALASLWLVLANDLSGFSWWTPGNLLGLAGFAVLAAFPWNRGPSARANAAP